MTERIQAPFPTTPGTCPICGGNLKGNEAHGESHCDTCRYTIEDGFAFTEDVVSKLGSYSIPAPNSERQREKPLTIDEIMNDANSIRLERRVREWNAFHAPTLE